MLSKQTVISLVALAPLAVIGFLLHDKPTPPPQPATVEVVPSLVPTPSPTTSTNPTNRAAASLGVTDRRALERFNAKRDAKAFAHSYNIAVRLGVATLAAETSPARALAMLVDGVQGTGEMVHSFRELNPREIEAAASLVEFRDGKMVPLPEAEFTAIESEIKARALSCKYGACTDCIADVRTSNRLQQARDEALTSR